MTNDQRDKLIVETHAHVATIAATMEAHNGNEVIHTVPPCEAHKTLSNRLWAIGTMSVVGLIGTLWNMCK